MKPIPKPPFPPSFRRNSKRRSNLFGAEVLFEIEEGRDEIFERRSTMHNVITAVFVFALVGCAGIVAFLVYRIFNPDKPPVAASISLFPIGGDATNPLGQFSYLTAAEVQAGLAAEFLNWKTEFNKTYDSVEAEQSRFAAYLDTAAQLLAHNDPNFKVRPGLAADMTPEEQAKILGHASAPLVSLSPKSLNDLVSGATTGRKLLQAAAGGVQLACPFPFTCYPTSLDWTTVMMNGQSVVTPVKNQVRAAA